MKNIDEFKARVKPGGRTSKLSHMLEDMHVLREDGYTLAQIQDYLKSSGISVTIPGLSSYLKRHPKHPSTNHDKQKERGTNLQNSSGQPSSSGFKYDGTMNEKELF